MTYPPPPGYGQQPQQPGYPPQQPGGYSPQPPYGQPQQPGYPPPQQPGGYPPPPPPGGGYGGPPPMPPGGGGNGFGQFAKDTGKGLLWKIVPVVLVVLGLGIYFIVKFAGGSSLEEAASDLDDTDTSAGVAVGDCLSSWDMALSMSEDPLAELVVDCSSTEALWSVTQVEEDVDDIRADASGVAEDLTAITAICGEEVLGYQFGQTWKNYNYVVDADGGKLDYLICTESVETPDSTGRTPRMPDVGECFNDDYDGWFVADCATASYKVSTTIPVDPPVAMTEDEVIAEVSAQCGAEDYYWTLYQLTDAAATEYTGTEPVTGILCAALNY
jgi:hypothetical protein